MKKLIFYTLFFISTLALSRAGDKQVTFLNAISTSFSSARWEAHKTASINGMKVISTQTTRQGDHWVTTAKVISKH